MSRMARAASKSLLTAGLLTGLAAGAANFPARAAEATGAVPNFARDRSTTWIRDRPTGDDFLPPLSGPGPVMSAKDHPYVPNGRGVQPTYRVADLTNPILRPWAVEKMKKANDEVLAGKIPFITRERCGRSGLHRLYAPPRSVFLSDSNVGHAHQRAQPAATAYLFECVAFAESEAVMVWRIGRPL